MRIDLHHGPPPGIPVGTHLRELWERRGRRTVVAGGAVWARSHGPLYTCLAPEVRFSGAGQDLDGLLREAGLVAMRFCAAADGPAESGAFVVDVTGYGLANVQNPQRRNVQKGLRACVVREIDAAELRARGLNANRDTLRRQGRHDPEFEDETGWTRFTQALHGIPELRIHAAFVGTTLASYAITSREGEWLRLLWKASDTELRQNHTDPALDFTLLREAAATPGVRYVVNGHAATLGDPGLERYKRGLGFTLRPHHTVTRLHPLLSPLVANGLVRRAVHTARELLPDDRRLALGERLLAETRDDRLTA